MMKNPKHCLYLNLPLFGMSVGEICVVDAWGCFDVCVTCWVDDGMLSFFVVSNLKICLCLFFAMMKYFVKIMYTVCK